MAGYGLLGFMQGLEGRTDQLREQNIQDKEVTAQLDREKADTQAQTLANQRAQALAPGELEEQQKRLGLLDTQGAQAKQSLDQGAQGFSTEQQLKHYQLMQDKLALNDEQMQNLHSSALAATRLMNAQLQQPVGAPINTSAIEEAFNENAPAGHRIQPGTLSITRAQDPMQSTVSYKGDDGQMHNATVANWNQFATSFMPPPKPVVLDSGQTAYNPLTGQQEFGAPPGSVGLGKVDPTAWTNQASRQMNTAFGGILDVNGNVTGLSNDTAARVSRLAGIAGRIGQATGYSAPAPTVVGAVKQAYDEMQKNGQDETSPEFMPRVQQILQGQVGNSGGGYGIGDSQPSSQAPYAEGTHLQDGAGKYYTVQNGVPVLNPGQ